MGTTIDVRKAQPFQGERLKVAREFRGWTRTELSKRLRMPIKELELGKAQPLPPMVKRMALCLGFPVEWFTKPIPPDPFKDGIHFCCSTSLCDNEECGERSIALCDYPMAGGGTCDAKICSNHGTRVARNKDYCWQHPLLCADGRITAKTSGTPSTVIHAK